MQSAMVWRPGCPGLALPLSSCVFTRGLCLSLLICQVEIITEPMSRNDLVDVKHLECLRCCLVGSSTHCVPWEGGPLWGRGREGRAPPHGRWQHVARPPSSAPIGRDVWCKGSVLGMRSLASESWGQCARPIVSVSRQFQTASQERDKAAILRQLRTLRGSRACSLVRGSSEDILMGQR